MPIIAVANQKGGVGKTTTVVNLGAALHEMGKRVLVVDFDPQASLTVHLGIKEPESLQASCGHVLRSAASGARWPTFRDILVQTPTGLDLIPSGRQLATAEPVLYAVPRRQLVLREALAPLREEYEYILVDCLPTTNLLVINALSAADGVVIPVQTDFLATQGLAQILQAIKTVREQFNPTLEVLGILLTMADLRTQHSRTVIENVRRAFYGRIRVFETMVRLQVGFKESSKQGTTILQYAPDSPSATAYRNLAQEVIAAIAAIDNGSYVPDLGASGKSPVAGAAAIEEAATIARAQAEQMEKEATVVDPVPAVSANGASTHYSLGAHAAASSRPAGTCPNLGMNDDRARVDRQPNDAHACYAEGAASSLDLATQAELCLTNRHQTCTRYMRARMADLERSKGSPFSRLFSRFRPSDPRGN